MRRAIDSTWKSGGRHGQEKSASLIGVQGKRKTLDFADGGEDMLKK
jgi:hypothetical protein